MAREKIVVITRNMVGNGAERVIAQLANYFAAQGKQCNIITLNDDEVFYKLDPSISVLPVGEKSGNKVLDKLLRYRQVRKMVLQEKPDLVLSMPEEIAVYVLLALLGTKIPVYVSERNNPWVMPDVKVTRILRKFMYPVAKGIIFQTEMAKSFFPEAIQQKGVVLKNPVDAGRIPAQYRGEREKVIVGAGRLSEQKNMPLLLKAFGKFAAGHPEFRLRIFGEGELREELTELARQGYGAYVLFVIQMADVLYLHPNDRTDKPFGIALREAKKAGVEILAYDCKITENTMIMREKVEVKL